MYLFAFTERYNNVEAINKDYCRGLLNRRERNELLLRLYNNNTIDKNTFDEELRKY